MSFMSALTQGLPQPSQGGISSGNMYPGTQQLNSQHYLSRVPSLPENIYGTSQMYAPSAGAVAGAASRQDTSAYYPVKKPSDSMKLPTVVGQHYYVDHMMNPHPYSSLYPFDINAIRRKNATRETTGPLKAWLKQHRQNPYPTKGEKVMLAIATRMTMTQVSTWFANARRRMKKDKFDDDDEEKDDMPCPDADKKRERSGSISSRVSHTSSEGDTSKDFSDASDAEELSLKSRPARKCVQRLFSPDARVDHVIDPSSSPESLSERSPTTEQAFYQQRLPTISDIMHNVGGNNDTRSNDSIIPTPKTTDITSERPKIWSISEIIGSATQTVNADLSSNYNDYVPYYSNVSQYYQYQGLDAYGYHASDLGLQHQDTGIKLETDTNSNVQYL